MQPNGMMYMRNDFWSILLTGVYAADRLARAGSTGMLIVNHSHPTSGPVDLHLPVVTIDQFCEQDWKTAVLPDEMSFFVGLEFVEISGDSNHPSVLSAFEFNSTPGDLPDPSIIAQDLIETGGFLCPLLWANAKNDDGYQSWMQRDRQPWLSTNVLWTENPSSPAFNSAGYNHPWSWNAKVNPVFNFQFLATNGSSYLATLESEHNRVTGSLEFMLYDHHPIHYTIGQSNPTRVHVGDPVELSEHYHPRASWASHLTKALLDLNTGLSDWQEKYGVILPELVGNWTGNPQLQWQTPNYPNDFYEQFLTHIPGAETESAGMSGPSSNAVMYVTTFVSASGYRFLVPDIQYDEYVFGPNSDPQVAVMNYIPAKREFTRDTTIGNIGYPIGQETLNVPDLDEKGFSYVHSVHEGAHTRNTIGFQLLAPVVKDKQTALSTGFLEPTFGLSTHIGSGLDVILDLSLSGRQTPVLSKPLEPTAIQHWDASPSTGTPIRGHSIRFIYPSGGAGLCIGSHTPPTLPSTTHGPVDLISQFFYDGVVLYLSDGTTYDYFDLEALPDTGLHSFAGAPNAFASNGVVDGWTVSNAPSDLLILLDEYSGAFNIYSELQGFANGLLFSQLDDRLTTGGWSADDYNTRCLFQSFSVATGAGSAIMVKLGERSIKPEEEGSSWQNLLTNLLSI